MFKKMKVFILPCLFLFGLLLSLNSCGIGFLVRGVVKGSLKEENKSLPESFNPKNETILVMMWNDGSYDKYARKAFTGKYKGKVEYVSFADLKKGKYQDVETYRYAFSQGPTNMDLYTKDSFSYSFSGSRPFHILDRKTGTFYRLTVTSGFYYRVMQAYAMKFEKIRRGI